jgi:hypothetical protein
MKYSDIEEMIEKIGEINGRDFELLNQSQKEKRTKLIAKLEKKLKITKNDKKKKIQDKVEKRTEKSMRFIGKLSKIFNQIKEDRGKKMNHVHISHKIAEILSSEFCHDEITKFGFKFSKNYTKEKFLTEQEKKKKSDQKAINLINIISQFADKNTEIKMNKMSHLKAQYGLEKRKIPVRNFTGKF